MDAEEDSKMFLFYNIQYNTVLVHFKGILPLIYYVYSTQWNCMHSHMYWIVYHHCTYCSTRWPPPIVSWRGSMMLKWSGGYYFLLNAVQRSLLSTMQYHILFLCTVLVGKLIASVLLKASYPFSSESPI